MKKGSSKQNKQSTKGERTKREITELNDIGLEPPKIYRKTQEVILDNQGRREDISKRIAQRSQERKNPTRAQTRERQTKKRKQKNAVRKALIWSAVVAVVIAIGIVLSLTVFFHINNVKVSGSKKYTNDEILAVCTIDKGENLFVSNTAKAKEIIEEQLPYVYNAEIRRKLPDTIQITVTDAKVAYSVKQKDKKYTYLDDNFKVLEKNKKKSKGIKISRAEIKSNEAGHRVEFKNADAADCLYKLSACIKENNFNEITEIYCKNISDNYVVYDKRITFKLGTCDDLENKIYKGLAACEQLNESSPNVKGLMTISSDKSVYFTED
jgi:hypothetical protein